MRRPPVPPSQAAAAATGSESGSGSSGGRISPPLLALLAAAVLLCGYEWYRRQLQDEQDDWLRQREWKQQQQSNAASPASPAVVAGQLTSPVRTAASTAPAWCDRTELVELWRVSERVLTGAQQLIPLPVERAILSTSPHTARQSNDQHTAATAHLSSHTLFTHIQSSLSDVQSALQVDRKDKEAVLSAITVHLTPLQRSLVLLALHPLLPPSIRTQSVELIDLLSSSSPALSESLVGIGGSALVGHIAHHSPISPSLFIAYQRQLQYQQDAFHQQQLLDTVYAQSGEVGASSHAIGGASGALCEIDELLSVLKSMPNLHRHLHVYLHKQQQEDERGAGAESTLPSLHPSLAKEDLEVLNRVPIELTSRPPATSSSSTADVLSTASHAVSSLLTAFLARYTYSYNAVQQNTLQQMERRRIDDHFHAVRLLASLCEQREVCSYLMDRGMMPLLAQWYEKGGLSREMRVKVQLSRLVANANSHPTAPDTADICLHSPLILDIIDWAHSNPLQHDDHFLPVNLPILPAEASNLYTAALAQDTPPPASPSFPAILPTRDSLTAQRAVDALSTFRQCAPARLHHLRQNVVSSISALSSSLPPAVRSRLPSPTSALPDPSPPLTTAEVAASSNSAGSVHQAHSGGVKQGPTAVSLPPRVVASSDSHSSLLNVLNSQAVRALANLYAQMERRREKRVYTATERCWMQQQTAAEAENTAPVASDDGGDGVWDLLLSSGRAAHPLYADEVYLIHPAFVPLSTASAPASVRLSSASASNKPPSQPFATPLRSSVSSWYPSTPAVDIVFVHGLLGNPLRTWRLHTSHDEKVAARDKQLSGEAESSKEADPTEAQLIALHAIKQQLRDFIAYRQRPDNIAETATQPNTSAVPAASSTDITRQRAMGHSSPAAQLDVTSRPVEAERAEEGEEERDVQSSDAEVIWPRDWLPSALPDNVRILSIGFRSSLLHEHDSTGNSLADRAEQFIHKLHGAAIPAAVHSPATSSPTPNVIWITHSMGGLLAKQMLYTSPSLLSSTLGLVFLATPHAGAWLPKNSTTRALFGFIATPSVELDQLEENSPHLLTLNRHIQQYIKQLAADDSGHEQLRLRVLSLGEGQPTPLPPNRPTSPFSLLLVPSKSSNPGYGEWLQLDCDHLNIAKPHSQDSVVYRTLVDFIRERIEVRQHLEQQRPAGDGWRERSGDGRAG